jgi:hypothetical protein
MEESDLLYVAEACGANISGARMYPVRNQGLLARCRQDVVASLEVCLSVAAGCARHSSEDG